MTVDEGFAMVLLHQVTPYKINFRAFLLECSFSVLGVLDLLRKVRDRDAFATLSGEHDGGSTANSTISSRNDGGFPSEPKKNSISYPKPIEVPSALTFRCPHTHKGWVCPRRPKTRVWSIQVRLCVKLVVVKNICKSTPTSDMFV